MNRYHVRDADGMLHNIDADAVDSYDDKSVVFFNTVEGDANMEKVAIFYSPISVVKE